MRRGLLYSRLVPNFLYIWGWPWTSHPLDFSSEYWDYGYTPPCPVYVVLEMKPRDPRLAGKPHSTNWDTLLNHTSKDIQGQLSKLVSPHVKSFKMHSSYPRISFLGMLYRGRFWQKAVYNTIIVRGWRNPCQCSIQDIKHEILFSH